MGAFGKFIAKIGGGGKVNAKSTVAFDSGASSEDAKSNNGGGEEDDDFLAEYNAQLAGEGEGDDPMAFYNDDNARKEALGAWGTRPEPSYSSAKESEAEESEDDASAMDIDDIENYGGAGSDSDADNSDVDSDFDELAGPSGSSNTSPGAPGLMNGGGGNAWDEKPPIDWNSEDEESDAEADDASEADRSDNEDADVENSDAENSDANDGDESEVEFSEAEEEEDDNESAAPPSFSDSFGDFGSPGLMNGGGGNAWDEKPPIDWNSEDEASDAEAEDEDQSVVESAAESAAEEEEEEEGEQSDAEASRGSFNDSFGSFGGASESDSASEAQVESENEESDVDVDVEDNNSDFGGGEDSDASEGEQEEEQEFDDVATEDVDESAFEDAAVESVVSSDDDAFFNEYGKRLSKEVDEEDPMKFYESTRISTDNGDAASVGTDDEATMAQILGTGKNSLAFESFNGSLPDSDASDDEDEGFGGNDNDDDDDDVGFGFVNQSPSAMMQAENPNFGVEADDRSIMTNSTNAILFGNLEGVNDSQAESFFAKHPSPDMDERGITRGMELFGVTPVEADEDDAPMRWVRRTQMMNYNDLAARKHPFRDLLGPKEAVSLVSVVLQSTYTATLDMGKKWNSNVSTSSLGSARTQYVVGKTRRILLLTTAPNARLLIIEPYSNSVVDQVALDDPRKIKIIVISKNEFSMRCIREGGAEVEWRFTDLLVPATLWVNVCDQCGITPEDIIERGYANCLGATNSPQRIAMFGKLSKRTVNGKNQRWRKRFVLLVGKQLAWFKNDDDWRPRGLLILDESVTASMAQDERRKNCFDLETEALPNGVRIHVGGKDRCDEWLTSIQSLLDHSRAKASGTPATISRASEGPMYCLMVNLEPKMEQVRTTTNALSMRLT